MNGSELNRVKRALVGVAKSGLRENLFAIISIGSFTTGHHRGQWSDIDLLIVLEQMGLADKERIARLKLKLEKKFHCRFGVNIIKKQEGLEPFLPEISLDGKTLQGLLDLHLHPERLLYCKIKAPSFFVPDRKTIRTYSLSNIAMFLLKNRKSLTSGSILRKNEFKTMVEREIRAAFIITKLGIQYRGGRNCNNYKDVIRNAKIVFPKFDFSTLTQNEEAISRWGQVHSTTGLRVILERTDRYIELFSHFILRKSLSSIAPRSRNRSTRA